MRLILCTALAAVCCAPIASADPFDRLLPDSTAVYMSIENMKRSKGRFDKSALGALWKDAAVQAFLEKPLKKWDEEMAKIQKKAGFTPEDVFRLIEGQIALAIPKLEFDQAGEPKDPSPVVLVDIGGNADKVKELVAKVEQGRLAELGLRRTEEEFRGVTIVKYVHADDEENAKRHNLPRAWYLDGKTFALAEDVEPLKALLARKGDTDSPSLATSESYRRVRARLGEEPDLVAYVGMAAINKALAEVPDEDMAMGRAILGTDSIDGIGMQGKLGRGGLTLNLFVSIQGQKQGLLKLFDAKNAPLTPPKWVPADATDVTTMAVDFNELLAEAKRVAARVGHEGAIEGFFEIAKGSLQGVDIEKDIFGSLGKEVTFFSKTVEGGGGGGMFDIPPITMAIELKDKEKLSGALDKLVMLIGQIGFAPEEQNYMDVKVRSLNLMFLTAHFALLKDQFLVSTNVDMVKDVIRLYGKDAKGIVDGEEFGRAMNLLPQGRILVGFQRFAKALREGLLVSLLQADWGNELDMNLFPKAEVFEKYLDVAASAMVNEEGGIFYTYVLAFKTPADDG